MHCAVGRRRCLRAACLALLIALPTFVGARVAGEEVAAAVAQAEAEPATVVLWNRPIVVFRKAYAGRTPQERAERVQDHLGTLPFDAFTQPVRVTEFRNEFGDGRMIEVGQFPVFRIFRDDLDLESGEALDTAAQQAADNLTAALRAYVEQRQWSRLVRGIIWSALATVLFVAFLWAVLRSRQALTRRLVAASSASLKRVSRWGLDVRQLTLRLSTFAVRATATVLVAAAAYLWLTFVFVQFPYSEPWGTALGAFMLRLAATLAGGAIHAVPGLVTVVVILLLARGATRALSQTLLAVEHDRIRLPWVRPETADATRRILIVVIWVFALTVAYPYVPGSGSTAFKGISVLLGVMLSLGSAGVVNQVMSGLVVVYSRAFRIGDYVRIGDVEGTVSEIGTLSTKINNLRREEITIPNNVVVGTTATNFTRLAAQGGVVVSTAVTIGYDAPWRQVHAMLQLAAERTPGVCKTPPPRVVQRALSDFYVEYQLIADLEPRHQRPIVLSDLHANIQDVFNEHDVQILSPHFVGQPAAAVVVPQSKWFTPPAKAPGGESC